MPENDQTDRDQNEEAKKPSGLLGDHPPVQVEPVSLPVGLRWILASGVVVLLGLLTASILVPNLSERVKFFTGNALSLLVLGVIAVQAYIYRKQWETMEQQGRAMKDQLQVAKHQHAAMEYQMGMSKIAVQISERNLKAAELSAEAAQRSVEVVQENTIYAQRAYISVTPEPSDQYHFQLRIENSGNTPACDVEIFANSNVFPGDEAVAFDEQGDFTSLGVIGPRCFYTKVFGIGRTIYSGEFEVWRKERMNLYCWGRVKYRDTFGNADRNTWFCFYKVTGSEQTFPYSVGNNAT